jgi:hypothetical protein
MALRKLVFAAAFLLACVTAAFGQDFSGKWSSKFESQVGEQNYSFDFKVDGEKLTGKIVGELKGEKRPAVDVKEGKVKGSDISFVEMLNLKDMEIRIEYSGKIKGDEIMLKRKVGDFAEYDITLKRVKDEKKDKK